MDKIDIQITKASVHQINIEYKDDMPEVTASIKLFTANNKVVTTFSVSSWQYANNKFDLPIEMIPAINDIAKRMEKIVINYCNKELNLLEVKS